jgi:hypothetical protein
LPQVIATIVSSDKATLYELQTVYSLEDAWLLTEVLAVDAHNRRAMAQHKED